MTASRRQASKKGSAISVALALSLGAIASAGTGSAQELKATGSVSGSAKPQAEVGVTAAPSLTPEEQVAQAEAIARRGNGLAQRLTKMLGEARKDKDIMRANCVNRKLTEVNANVRNVDSRSAAFKDAVKNGNKDISSHEFTVLSVLSSKFDVLDQEAAQCLGQSVFEPGASQVVTTVPSNVNVLTDPSVTPPQPAAPPSVVVPASRSGTE